MMVPSKGQHGNVILSCVRLTIAREGGEICRRGSWKPLTIKFLRIPNVGGISLAFQILMVTKSGLGRQNLQTAGQATGFLSLR
mmetsp:Transcript_88965/g.237274  ORF Transcript_88965/g.237274 Transcript_88965/m.237274 type:complete len:83 (+) Transcript_88965:161-409(+)